MVCFEGGVNIFVDPAEELLDVLHPSFSLGSRITLEVSEDARLSDDTLCYSIEVALGTAEVPELI